MAKLRDGIVTWLCAAVLFESPGSLLKSFKRVSSVSWLKWWILLRRARRFAMACGGGLFTIADETTLAMYRWSFSVGMFNLGLE